MPAMWDQQGLPETRDPGLTDANLTWMNFTGGEDAVHSFRDRVASHDDATWILTSAFIVFTMQSGFGLLESGSVSTKNEVNIMVKNAVDVIFGGLSYWIFGFGFSFGEGELANPFCGWGNFLVSNTNADFGWTYSKFFFQASFATTATTIVSGAMAERTKLEAYIIFSFMNTFVVCFPAHWVWARNGWLVKLGMIDIAGAGPVHLVGGVTGLVATLMLRPRHKRYHSGTHLTMGSPSNAILGMFMLWWGWLGFNCGSTFGISGLKWKLAARSAVATLCSSFAGGTVGLAISYLTRGRQLDVPHLINGVLSSLVSITGLCAMAQPWEAFVIGTFGSALALGSIKLLDRMHIDDPVGCVGVHAVGGIWGLVVVGLLTQRDVISDQLFNINSNFSHNGLFKGGGAYLLGVQVLATVAIIGWTLVTSYVCLKAIDLTIGLRVSLEHEILGSDLVEHGVGGEDCTYDKLNSQIVWFKSSPPNLSRSSSVSQRKSYRPMERNGISVKPCSTTENWGRPITDDNGGDEEAISSSTCFGSRDRTYRQRKSCGVVSSVDFRPEVRSRTMGKRLINRRWSPARRFWGKRFHSLSCGAPEPLSVHGSDGDGGNGDGSTGVEIGESGGMNQSEAGMPEVAIVMNTTRDTSANPS